MEKRDFQKVTLYSTDSQAGFKCSPEAQRAGVIPGTEHNQTKAQVGSIGNWKKLVEIECRVWMGTCRAKGRIGKAG